MMASGSKGQSRTMRSTTAKLPRTVALRVDSIAASSTRWSRILTCASIRLMYSR
jgi:hypothetical protein